MKQSDEGQRSYWQLLQPKDIYIFFFWKHHKLGEGFDIELTFQKNTKKKNEVVLNKIWTRWPKTEKNHELKPIFSILFWSFSDRWLHSFTLTPSHWLKWDWFIPKLLLVYLVSLLLLEFPGTWGLSDTWICAAVGTWRVCDFYCCYTTYRGMHGRNPQLQPGGTHCERNVMRAIINQHSSVGVHVRARRHSESKNIIWPSLVPTDDWWVVTVT